MPKSYFSPVLQLVRGNSPYTVLILAIFTLLLKLQALAHPLLPIPDAGHALFGWLVWLLSGAFGKSATAFSMLAVLMCFLQGIYLKAIAAKHRMFARPSYMPAFIYIVLSSLHPAFGQFSAPLLMNWLLLGALDALLRFGRREGANRVVYNAGFLLGCAGIVHFPAIVFALMVPLALLWLRHFRPGEWIVALLGILSPFYFSLGLLFLFEKTSFISSWPAWSLLHIPFEKPGAYLLVLLLVLLFLLGAGLLILVRTLFQMTVTLRRGWALICFMLVLAIGSGLFSGKQQPEIWLCVAPCLTLITTPPLLAENQTGRRRSGRFATFTFYLFLALLVFCQLALPT
ncbi:MAG: hypothetical protein JST06_06575 [Bacteroidetes bacterium]|nr:hypothetical protein [Bacteroidota bacterium]